jgi:outer membrane protein OmpA-like peptidoglycan-associated protein
MKKILLFCLAGCFFFQLNAQKYSDFSHWSIALHVGGAQLDGDLTQTSSLIPGANAKLTGGLSVENTITPLYGLGFEYLFLPFSGNDAAPAGYHVNGTAHEASLYWALNILNCFHKTRDSKWNLYARLGAGLAYYKSDVDIFGVPNIGESVSDFAVFVPVGVSLEYNINQSFAVGARIDYRAHNKDNLDGAQNNWDGVTNDFMAVGTIDLRYKFGATEKDHTRNINLQTYESSLNKEIEKKIAQADSTLAAKLKELEEKENKIKDLEPRLNNLEKMMTTDTDGDGVLDYMDKCPDTPVSEKANVDAYGCTKVPVVDLSKIAPEFKNIYFDTDKSNIKASEEQKLKDLIETLKSNSSAKVVIRAYTDDVASDEYNKKLAAKRAASVKKYLVDNGIKANRVVTNAYGKINFVESNDTPEGKAFNRRVEFDVIF